MRYRHVVLMGALLAAPQVSADAMGQPLPVQGGRPVVAVVNGDPISVDELLMQGSPSGRARLLQGRGTVKDLELVERLITIKLIVQEAGRMGLDEAPEIRKQVDVTSREILREVLMDRLVKNVQPDPVLLERLYRDLVREWKTTALLFQDQTAAQRARLEIADGRSFEEVAAGVVAAKTARPDSDGTFHGKRDLLPQIVEALASLGVGRISPVIRIQAGFAIVKVIAIRYPEDAAARAEARRQALSQRQIAFLASHEKAMRRQYVVVNTALLDGLDYTATKPGLEALLKDTRVVAQIKGAASVTVGDLTDYLRLQFFHGTDQAKQRQEMNAKKTTALEATLGRRLLNMEALKLGIDRTAAYRDRLTGYRESLVFDRFVQKVVAPENKMKEDEVRRHYSSHLKDYSSPEMVKARSVGFAQRTAAEAAMKKLREGTDFGWLTANADGRLRPGTETLVLDGRPVMVTSLPDGVQKSLAGCKPGEHRLYASPQGQFYVMTVQQTIAPTPRPYDEVREEIARTLYGDKIKKGVETYAAKLRAQSTVRTYLRKVQ